MAKEGMTTLHVGVHSFTPVLNGEVRRADVGLLFDPSRPLERSTSRQWQALLQEALPDLVIRRNYPYRGVCDGLTTALRRQFPADQYIGIELEVNNKHLIGKASRARDRLRDRIVGTLRDVLRTATDCS